MDNLISSADVYFITESKGVSLKALLALLNAKWCYFWLYHKGKRKGEALELYQQPLSEIPIPKISKNLELNFRLTDLLYILNLLYIVRCSIIYS